MSFAKRNKKDQELKESPRRKNQDEIAYLGYRRVPTKEKAKLVLGHFNSIARKYDFMNTLLSFGLQHFWKRYAIRKLRLKAGDKVIDVCGGTADLSIRAAKIVGPTGRVILYDINRAMIEAGRPKVDRASFGGRIRYVQGDAERISFAGGQFDAALVGFGIRNLTRMGKGLEEMYRVLKPEGKLMCLEFSKPTTTLFGWFYDLYSFYIMPFIGKIITGSREAYTYLPESIRMFPSPEGLKTTLGQIGFSRVTYWKLTKGIAVIHIGMKVSPLPKALRN